MTTLRVCLVVESVALILAGTPSRAADSSALPGIPSIFGKIDWRTTEGSLKELLPQAKIDSSKYRGLSEPHMVSVNASDFVYPVLGQASLALVGKEKSTASFIELSTAEVRPACSAETGIPGRECRNSYHHDLVRIFSQVEKALVDELGPPSATRNPSAKNRSRSLRWDRKDVQVFLSLEKEENEGWRVAVSAKRLGAPL